MLRALRAAAGHKGQAGGGGGGGGAVITVTEGSWTDGFGTTWYGFSAVEHVIGSVLPTTYGGNLIKQLYYVNGTLANEFYVVLAGLHAQDYFTSVTPQDASALLSASVFSYGQGGGVTSWRWFGGALSIPARWDGSGTSTVTFA